MMIDRPRLIAEKDKITIAALPVGRILRHQRRTDRRVTRHYQRWLLISLGLHMLLALGLVRQSSNRPTEDSKPPIYADLVMIEKHVGESAPQAKFTSGTGKDAGPQGMPQPVDQADTQDKPPTPPTTPAAPAAAQEAPPPPPPDPDAEPVPAAAPASPPAPPAPPQQQAAAAPAAAVAPAGGANPPQTNLGDGMDLGNWQITGPHVKPPGIDSSVHNVPPVYPPEAARAGESGTVVLNVTVGPDGSAEKIEVTNTSGYQRLDDAAKAAVSRWHFTPGQQDGIAVDRFTRFTFASR